MEVAETNGTDEVKLKVIHGGILKSRKGVNLPNTKISLPSLTPKDEVDLDYILTRPEVDWIALSFVRYAEDMTDLRERIQARGHSAKMIAKIEAAGTNKQHAKFLKPGIVVMTAALKPQTTAGKKTLFIKTSAIN